MHAMNLQLNLFKISEYVIAIQRTFRAHFMLCPNDGVEDRKIDSTVNQVSI